VFSFHVSLQGHFPYNTDGFDREDNLWTGEGISDSTRYQLNNYLSLIRETQEILLEELDKIRDDPSPTVVLIYGDHKPWFGDSVYTELGIPISMETEQGMIDYLGTPYLIWANQAAKAVLHDDMTGEGPMTSPGYLMNILFDRLGWKGPAFMQFTEEIQERIPVICTKGGYIEDGVYTQNLSDKGKELLKQYQDVQYYVRYKPELAR
jgi:phosphoglycerol transferase MdoB-like AlkP superfamily enzyme